MAWPLSPATGLALQQLPGRWGETSLNACGGGRNSGLRRATSPEVPLSYPLGCQDQEPPVCLSSLAPPVLGTLCPFKALEGGGGLLLPPHPPPQLLSPRDSPGSLRTPVYMWPASFSSAEGRDSEREGGEWGREDRGVRKEGGRKDSGASGFPHRPAPWPLGPGLLPTQGAPNRGHVSTHLHEPPTPRLDPITALYRRPSLDSTCQSLNKTHTCHFQMTNGESYDGGVQGPWA